MNSVASAFGDVQTTDIDVQALRGATLARVVNRCGTTVRQLYPRIATAATSGRSIVLPTSDVIGSCSTA